MPYYNKTQNKGSLRKVIADCFEILGRQSTIDVLDAVKDVGFLNSTRSGMSFGYADLTTPAEKEGIIADADKQALKYQKAYMKGMITGHERHRNVRDVWNHATEQIGKRLMDKLEYDTNVAGSDYINPVYAMAVSKARGNETQVRQLAGMRGLMAKPNGEIIETPIRASFKDGLRVLEYFTSTHGARKGLADTALKTADSGYLTRKLVDVGQDVILVSRTAARLPVSPSRWSTKVKPSSCHWRMLSSVARPATPLSTSSPKRWSFRKMTSFPSKQARRIEEMGFEKIRVRSPLTCESRTGICQKCYGMDLSRGREVELGLAAGVIAAQSIGEPGTQLTMRTFHIGGVAGVTSEDTSYKARKGGTIEFENLRTISNSEGKTVVLNRNGEVVIKDKSSRIIERFKCTRGLYHVR